MSAQPRPAPPMSASEALALVEDQAGELPRADLPGLIAELERVKTVALGRYMGTSGPAEDRLLEVAEAASILGISRSTLYKEADRYPFTVRAQDGRLRFSRVGIQDYLARQRGDGRRRS